jgi:predicted restriction endonuclease
MLQKMLQLHNISDQKMMQLHEISDDQTRADFLVKSIIIILNMDVSSMWLGLRVTRTTKQQHREGRIIVEDSTTYSQTEEAS